jgi:hypothetical protein
MADLSYDDQVTVYCPQCGGKNQVDRSRLQAASCAACHTALAASATAPSRSQGHLAGFLARFGRSYPQMDLGDYARLASLNTAQGVGATASARALPPTLRDRDCHRSLAACGVADAPALRQWCGAMLRSLTTPEGMPLPGSMFLQGATGMDLPGSVHWLLCNSRDIIALDHDNIEYDQLEAFFRRNPQVFKVALAVGATWGLMDEDPISVAYGGIRGAQEYQRSMHSPASREWEGTRCFMRNAWRGHQSVGANAFLVSAAAAAAGMTIFEALANGVDAFGGLAQTLDGITRSYRTAWSVGGAIGKAIGEHDFGEAASFVAEAGSLTLDVVEGAATLGVGLAAAYGVKKAFEWINGEKSQEAQELGEKVQARARLRALVEGQAALPYVMHALIDAHERGVYRPMLAG